MSVMAAFIVQLLLHNLEVVNAFYCWGNIMVTDWNWTKEQSFCLKNLPVENQLTEWWHNYCKTEIVTVIKLLPVMKGINWLWIKVHSETSKGNCNISEDLLR